jgi:hypothetical protein
VARRQTYRTAATIDQRAAVYRKMGDRAGNVKGTSRPGCDRAAAYRCPIFGMESSRRYGTRRIVGTFTALAVPAGLPGPATASSHSTTAGFLGQTQTGLSAPPSKTGRRKSGRASGWNDATRGRHKGGETGWNTTGHERNWSYQSDRPHGHPGEGSREHGMPSQGGSQSDRKSPTTAEQETARATTAAAVISFVALVGALIGILDNRRRVRQRLTYDWVERIGDLGLIEHQAVMSSFLRGGVRPPSVAPETWDTMDEQRQRAMRARTWHELSRSLASEDRKTILQIVAFPNMLEALAGMYNQRLLNRGIVKTHVEGQAIAFWSRAGWWIDELRLRVDPDPSVGPESNKLDVKTDKIYTDLEKMLKSLAKRKRPRRMR